MELWSKFEVTQRDKWKYYELQLAKKTHDKKPFTLSSIPALIINLNFRLIFFGLCQRV